MVQPLTLPCPQRQSKAVASALFLGPFSRLFLGLCNSFSSCQPLNPFAIGRRFFKLLFQCWGNPFFKGFLWVSSLSFLWAKTKLHNSMQSQEQQAHTPSPPTSCLLLFFCCYPCCFRTGCCCHPKTVLSKICTATQLCTMATFFKVLPNFLGHPFFKTITWPWKSLPCSRPSC